MGAGRLPDYLTLVAETDTNDNGLPDGVADGGVNPNAGGGGGANVGAAVGVIIVLLLVCGLGAFAYVKRDSLPCSLPGMGSSQGAVGLPPGWTSAIDPSSNRPYYTNNATGETSWDMPKGGAVSLQGMSQPAAPASQPLPPGWQSAIDPASSKPYYVRPRLEPSASGLHAVVPFLLFPLPWTGEHDHGADNLGAPRGTVLSFCPRLLLLVSPRPTGSSRTDTVRDTLRLYLSDNG